MKKRFCIALIALLACFLCSCGAQGQDSTNTSTPTVSTPGAIGDDIQTVASFFPIQTYAVYEVYNGNEASDFDAAMKANPLDAKMQKDLQAQNLTGTREQQVFLDTCLRLWQAELTQTAANFSIIFPKRKPQNLTRRKPPGNRISRKMEALTAPCFPKTASTLARSMCQAH